MNVLRVWCTPLSSENEGGVIMDYSVNVCTGETVAHRPFFSFSTKIYTLRCLGGRVAPEKWTAM